MMSKIIIPEHIKMKYDRDKKTRTKGYGDDFGVNVFSDSNKTISTSKAITIETVFTCIRDKSETVGRLPVSLYDKSEPGKVRKIEDGRLHKIFTRKPNDFMTMQGFMEFMAASYELHGAFYAYIAYNDRGSIMEIIPFKHQQNVKPAMDINGRVYFRYVTNDGTPALSFGIDDLFIINQFTLDGFTPISPIQYNASFLNGTYDTEDTWNSLQSDGVTAQFALATEKSVDAEAAQRLKKDWKGFRGAPGVGNIPVLEDGMTLKSLRLSPKDSELLGSREFSVNRICRIFRVPPERIGVPKSASSNQTMLDIDEAYMRNGIEPIILKYENACNMLLAKLKVKKFIRVNRKAFYSGSPHRMVTSVAEEIKMGLASINEARLDLNRDPVDGGDVFVIDSNNLTFGTWNELPSVREQVNGKQPDKPAKGDKNEE
jgi:HK97 family phage portal protein